jgi:carboxylesterase
MTSASIIEGAEPLSHVGTGTVGLLALHGFTGNPSSMRAIADAAAADGLHVELPRLPGHGTAIEEMLDTAWADWTAEVEAAYGRLAARVDTIIVTGLSMGGSLTLWAALQHPETAGIVCVNAATQPQGDDVIEMIREMIEEGNEVMPGIGGDIADPDVVESAYSGTPLRPLLSFQVDGLAPMADRYGELAMPALVITSRQDHVVEPVQSEHLVATIGGPVEHVWLERSYHVATQDYDRDLIIDLIGKFVQQVSG